MAWIAGKRGAYRVMWREGRGRGAPTKASRTFPDRLAAETYQRELEASQAARRLAAGPATDRTPLPALLLRWKASRLAAGRVRQTYADEVLRILGGRALVDPGVHAAGGIFHERGWKTLDDITPDAVDRWRTARDGVGVKKPLAQLKAFMKWCRNTAGLTIHERVLYLEPPRRAPKPPPPLLTDAQVAEILTLAYGCGFACGVLVEHLLLYGCRPVDVCRLEVRDWADGQITYRDTKNLADVRHPVHAQHGEKLDRLTVGRAASDPLFLDPWGRRWELDKKGSATRLFCWYRDHVALHLPEGQRGMYCLKDFAMTRLALAAGGNRKAVIAVSGHRSTMVVDRYLSTNADTQSRLITAIAVPEPATSPPPPAGRGESSAC